MLNRAVSPSTWEPSRWTNWRRALSHKETAILFRYLLAVAILSAVGCLYIAQVNAISNISSDTVELKKRAIGLEATNVVLMQQLAQLESPAYIEQQVLTLGMTPASNPLRVKVPMAGPSTDDDALSDLQRLAETTTANTTR